MKVPVIVAAGGKSTRFFQEKSSVKEKRSKSVPSTPPSKLLFELNGKPILFHSLSTFQKSSVIESITIPYPADLIKNTAGQIKKEGFGKAVLVKGGATRAESVFKALEKIKSKSDWVLVHDGARPFIQETHLEVLIQASKTEQADAYVLASPVVPTIKQVNSKNQVLQTLNRDELCQAETPQLVKKDMLLQAYEKLPEAFQATDEASLIERLGGRVQMVKHSGWNPKITTQEDLKIAQAVVRPEEQACYRTGFGSDLHRLVPGRKFMLGGVQIASPVGPLGHSDGDVLLHAISDALLGALGCGDIGDWFSDKNPKFKNLSSSKILEFCAEKVCDFGWSIQNIDTVIYLEKPKLGSSKETIKKKIASLLKIETTSLSIKAKTMEGLGPVGEGKAIQCEAIVTLSRSES